MELLTHLGGIFAELRMKRLLENTSKVFISYNVINEPSLSELISNRFDINVCPVTGLEEDESCSKDDVYQVSWISGAYFSKVTNLVPPKQIKISEFFFKPINIILLSVFVSLIPLPILMNQKKQLEREFEMLNAEHLKAKGIIQEIEKLKKDKEDFDLVVRDISPDLDNNGISTLLAMHVTECLPESTRLESLDVDLKFNKLELTGYTVDAESVLRYLDNLKKYNEILQPDISITDLESRRIKFVITASIGDLKGNR